MNQWQNSQKNSSTYCFLENESTMVHNPRRFTMTTREQLVTERERSVEEREKLLTQGKGQAFFKLLVQWFAASHSHTNTHTHT